MESPLGEDTAPPVFDHTRLQTRMKRDSLYSAASGF